MYKTKILKESCQLKVVLMKTKNKTFLTFVDKKRYFLPFCVWRLMTGFVQMGLICALYEGMVLSLISKKL